MSRHSFPLFPDEKVAMSLRIPTVAIGPRADSSYASVPDQITGSEWKAPWILSPLSFNRAG